MYERPRPSEHRRIIDDSSRKEGWRFFKKMLHARDGFECCVCNRSIIGDSSTPLVPTTSEIEIATRDIYEMKPLANDFNLFYVEN